MTNSEIIYKAALAAGYPEDQLDQLLLACGGVLPFHTFQFWKSCGYTVKRGEHACMKVYLWRFTNKANKAEREEIEKKGGDPEDDPHYYKKLCCLFSSSQVEKIASPEPEETAAPDAAAATV